MFGYDSTPRPLIASTPPSVIRIAMTQAKTGWWMKKRDMGDQSFCAASPACGSSAGLSAGAGRSEEHTSELQSLMRISYAVFCLKKKKQIRTNKKQTRERNTTTTPSRRHNCRDCRDNSQIITTEPRA